MRPLRVHGEAGDRVDLSRYGKRFLAPLSNAPATRYRVIAAVSIRVGVDVRFAATSQRSGRKPTARATRFTAAYPEPKTQRHPRFAADDGGGSPNIGR